jgi:hypothetical protein
MVRPSFVRHPLVWLLAAIALAGLVASGGTTAHVHDGVGLYNAEHDLTLLATFGGPAALVAGGPAIAPTPVVAPAPGFVIVAVADAPVPAAACRAPPLA